MRRMVEKILRYYGREIRIQDGEKSVEVHAFLQPVTGRGQNMIQIGVSPLGADSLGQYVYIGPVMPEITVGNVLELDGKQYVVRRTERIDGTNDPVYQWGMCVEKGAEDTWGLHG